MHALPEKELSRRRFIVLEKDVDSDPVCPLSIVTRRHQGRTWAPGVGCSIMGSSTSSHARIDEAELQRWLLTEGRAIDSMEVLLGQFAGRMRKEQRIPVDRIFVATKVLHPQAAAWAWIWEAAVSGDPQKATVSTKMASAEEFNYPPDSVGLRVSRGAKSVRVLASEPGSIPDDSRDLMEKRGYVDLYGLPLTIGGEGAGCISFATKFLKGFTKAHTSLFDAILPAVSAVIELQAANLVTGVLLRTYLGQDAGDRVHRGAVKRGDGTTLRTVIWFCDVRGFTSLSSSMSRDSVLELLNSAFDEIVGVLEENGGQVLKFMGDGVLGVFPEGENAEDSVECGQSVCRAARLAAQEVHTRLDKIREDRSKNGLPTAKVGVGLHYGDVSYGNIGSTGRLDFTVIGSAVNLASRVESLCGKLGISTLATEEFVKREDGHPWKSHGSHDVKGVPEPVEVFEPELINMR